MFTALRSVSSPLLLLSATAQGKHYANELELRAGWARGDDFKMYGSSSYTSIRDLARLQRDSSSITLHDVRTGISIVVG
jgi:hypothetical protein